MQSPDYTMSGTFYTEHRAVRVRALNGSERELIMRAGRHWTNALVALRVICNSLQGAANAMVFAHHARQASPRAAFSLSRIGRFADSRWEECDMGCEIENVRSRGVLAAPSSQPTGTCFPSHAGSGSPEHRLPTYRKGRSAFIP